MESAGLPIELWLARHAVTAWQTTLRPWLEAGRGCLERSYVIVATRGQAQALKQRCLVEGLPLLGVEFLTPGLARQKWRTHDQEEAMPLVPVMGRELLLLGLRVLVDARLAPLTPDEEEWGFWKSLQSDLERALDDFDALLKAGFRAEDFPLPMLRAVFVELTEWVASCGYGLAPLEAEAAGLAARTDEDARLGARVFVHLPGVELWGEFFNMAAFVRRCAQVTVVLPEPAWRGRNDLDERWVNLWQDLLGIEALPLAAEAPERDCDAVGRLWTAQDGSGEAAEVLIGKNRTEEMDLVAERIVEWLDEGAENIGVVFPRADAAHLRLAGALRQRGVSHADLLETAGPASLDTQAQRAFLDYQANGANLESLLALWPLLRALGSVTLSQAAVRSVCDRSFDLKLTHAVEAYLDEWRQREPEIARVIEALGPAWPNFISLKDGIGRLKAICTALEVAPPEGLAAVERLAGQEVRPLPKAAVIEALASFLPRHQPVRTAASGRNVFARVTLGTRRRMEGVPWSHLVFVESNAGVWPDPSLAGCWLTDEDRMRLNARGRFGLGLFTSEDRRVLERSGYTALARDTHQRIVFSAALADESDPEAALAPNAWLERVIWSKGWVGEGEDLGQAFSKLHRTIPGAPNPSLDVSKWHEVWRARRDPSLPFDEYFFAGNPAVVRPDSLAVRLVERSVADPAELWFEGVLGLYRQPWEPLARKSRKSLGLWAHGLLARALAGSNGVDGFRERLRQADARARLNDELNRLREQWPDDAYWRSFHGELTRICRRLLDKVYEIETGEYIASEKRLPADARITVGKLILPVRGRMDLVLLDRPAWHEANVDVVDFKTGGDQALSAKGMAKGASLQLGVYLAAVLSLGARDGRVWMIKPDSTPPVCVEAVELPGALAALAWLERALATGTFGALTPDRSEYSNDGYKWPLACTPVPYAVLRRKFEATFSSEMGGIANA